MIRNAMRGQKGRALKGDGHLQEKATAALPFTLTDAQKAATAEIDADMAAPARMLRLLQGDVGAGKTVVAMLALLNAVEAGTQGALMAPTEILARQHMAALERLGRSRGRQDGAAHRPRTRIAGREATLKALAAGEIDILVGTHALFSEDVDFRDLGLAVVDEQHRFGVHQRMKLQGKGGRPVDVLVMTATPIPRTLALTAYGDMDVSRLTGRPPGRKPVDTRVLPADRLDEVVQHLKRAIAEGRARLLGVPAGGGIREDRSRRSRRARRHAAKDAGRQGRSRPWPHEGPGARRGDGEVQGGRDARCWSPPP